MEKEFKFKITKIELDSKNRMLRAGFGKHDGFWFFRIDLWFVGYRLSGDRETK